LVGQTTERGIFEEINAEWRAVKESQASSKTLLREKASERS
jgi:hypothetical protein